MINLIKFDLCFVITFLSSLPGYFFKQVREVNLNLLAECDPIMFRTCKYPLIMIEFIYVQFEKSV